MKLTSIVLTKNSRNFIEGCLKSLRFCDEIIVIDDFSTDDTLNIVQNSQPDAGQPWGEKLRIFKRHLNNDFAAQRNFGLKFARGEWILFIDSDEVVPHELAEEILKCTNTDNYAGYCIRRRDFMWGEELKFGEVGDIFLVRLAKRNAGEWKRRVHEFWDVKLPVGVLKNSIKHFPHQNLDEYINKINWLSEIHAEENRREGKRATILKIIFWPVFKFIYNYFIRLGVLDGMPGFMCALIMSFHSYLSWSKLWFIQKKSN